MWHSDLPYEAMRVLVETNVASFLAGDFTSTLTKWQPFKAQDVRDGWAYFIMMTNDPSLIKSYKLSNNEKNYIVAIQHALQIIQREVSNVDLFYVQEAHIKTAARMATWLGIETVAIPPLLERKRNFVIAELSELAVSGRELMDWRGERGGPWVKQALDDILQAVLNNEVQNDTAFIKDWFLKR